MQCISWDLASYIRALQAAIRYVYCQMGDAGIESLKQKASLGEKPPPLC